MVASITDARCTDAKEHMALTQTDVHLASQRTWQRKRRGRRPTHRSIDCGIGETFVTLQRRAGAPARLRMAPR